MNFLTWSHHFETGLDGVDAQHHGLVDLINAVAPQLARVGEADLSGVERLLDQLGHYAVVHFRDEEALMVQANLDAAYIERHRHTHEAFVQVVGTMRRQSRHAGQLSGQELLRFLSSWLTFHILSEDQCMARQIHAVRAGATPQGAWALESQPTHPDAPHAVYTGALIDLFTVVNERNRKLSEVNEQLEAARAELAEANRQLEARVDERTRELQDSLARLAETQRQLGQAEKMAAVGQLAAGVAHEINNPVGFVSGNLSALGRYAHQLLTLADAQSAVLKASPVPEPASPEWLACQHARDAIDLPFIQEDLQCLLDESAQGLQRVRQIVKGLLVFARPEPAALEHVALRPVLEQAWQESLRIEPTGPLPHWDLQPLPEVGGDPAQLRQAFLNVMVNARQAVRSGGGIALAAGPLDKQGEAWVWVEVRDQGAGMSPEVQSRAFDPFFTTRPVGEGTGLGLSVAWEIVRHHGGTLGLCSGAHQGTTVRFELPCERPSTAQAAIS